MKKILIFVFLLALIGCEDGADGPMGPGGCDVDQMKDPVSGLCVTNPDYTPPKDGEKGEKGEKGDNGCAWGQTRDTTESLCIDDANVPRYIEGLEEQCRDQEPPRRLVSKFLDEKGNTINWFCEDIPVPHVS